MLAEAIISSCFYLLRQKDLILKVGPEDAKDKKSKTLQGSSRLKIL